MTTARLALRLAFSVDPRQRWRQLSVVLGSFIALTALLIGIGLVGVARDSAHKIHARSPVWATAAKGAVLDVSLRGMTVTGLGQIPVVWMQPRPGHESDPAAVPPGLRAIPGPGEAVLSEGLIRRGYNAQSLGFLPSSSGEGDGGAIGRQGLQTSSEGWIYARPAAGRTLGSGGALLALRGYRGSGPRADLETTPEIPSTLTMLTGVVALLLVPALLLLGGASRALSSLRDQRLSLLSRLGISTGQLRLLLGVETASLAIFGAVLADTLWFAVVAGAHDVPLVEVVLFPDALAVSWPLVVATNVLVATMAAFIAVLLTPISRHRPLRTRRVRAWHSLPLWSALGLMIAAVYQDQSSSLRIAMLFGGMILTLVALPTALPVFVTTVGNLLGRVRRPAVWLGGQRLALRARNLSRPAAVVGAFVFVAGAAFAFYDGLTAREKPSSARGNVAVVRLDWRGAQSGDLQTLSESAHGMTVLPVRESRSGAVLLVSDCNVLRAALASYRPAPCSEDNVIPPDVLRLVRQLTGLTAVVERSALIQNAPSQVAIFAPKGIDDVRLLQVAHNLPAVNINWLAGSEGDRRVPAAAWTILGWVVGSFLLMLTLTREVGDRALLSLQESVSLLSVGLTHREVRSVNRWSLLPPLALAIPVGYLGAVLFALIGFQLGVTAAHLVSVTVVAGAASLVALMTFLMVFRIHNATQRSDLLM